MKKLINILIFVLSIQVVFAQNFMKLGTLELIQPTPKSIIPTNTINNRIIKTSSKIGSLRAFNSRGGIIFEQTASPSKNLMINNISIDYNNGIVIKINGGFYSLANLPVWQLQPIVNYANDSCFDVLTIYGNDDCKIKMHPAFIDKLIGLRLLQVDLLLAGNYIQIDEGWDIPKINENYIFAPSEEHIIPSNGKKKEWVEIYSDKIYNIIHNETDQWSSYTFTDYKKQFTFSINEKNVIFNDTPYYLFQKIDTSNYDYDEFADFVKQYCSETINYTYDDVTEFNKIDNIKYSNYFYYLCKMYGIKYVSNSFDNITKNILNSSLKSLKDPYPITTSDCENDKNCNNFKKIDILIETNMNDTRKVSIYKKNKYIFMNHVKNEIQIIKYNNQKIFSETNSTNEFVRDILFLESLCDSNIILIIDLYNNINRLYFLYSIKDIKKYQSINDLKKICNNYYIEDIDFDLFYILALYKKNSYKVKTAENITRELNNNWTQLYNYNPIIFEVAKNTAQYAAFFRFIKLKSPNSWAKFVEKVNKLNYDAPQIITPINFNNTVYQRYEEIISSEKVE